ncbi:FixH family protein [Salirhabdus sp. Marseille-P4669]|uniref:FixH family protein n=1 Tax=Salirhabdus sp. Marseille-P4669 TaxID=2042310 RepID=UPI00135C00FE|nr:FixH family protein [Salirhabdus sp. Marseille-P4669]
MKWIVLLISMLPIIFISACSNENSNSDNQQDEQLPEMVEVNIQLPDKIIANENVKLSTLVMQGEEKVDDASDVTLEIWKEGVSEEDHEKILAEPVGNGLYSISYTFESPGTYHVISHVNARDMHVMPKETFEVTE